MQIIGLTDRLFKFFFCICTKKGLIRKKNQTQVSTWVFFPNFELSKLLTIEFPEPPCYIKNRILNHTVQNLKKELHVLSLFPRLILTRSPQISGQNKSEGREPEGLVKITYGIGAGNSNQEIFLNCDQPNYPNKPEMCWRLEVQFLLYYKKVQVVRSFSKCLKFGKLGLHFIQLRFYGSHKMYCVLSKHYLRRHPVKSRRPQLVIGSLQPICPSDGSRHS